MAANVERAGGGFAEQAATLRFDGVDCLRGISILLVVLLHGRLRLLFSDHPVRGTMPNWLHDLLFTNGDYGVTIFFAVSGFLITLTSLRRFGSLAAMRPMRFYRIRFARIAPLLLAVLAVLSALHLAHADGFVIREKWGSLGRAVLAALTFHLNWIEAARGYLPGNWDVLWSLSVEEMFYLFFPLVCVALLRRRWGMYLFLALLAAFVGMGPAARTVWTANPIWQEKTYLGGMDAIAMGCLTALLVDRLQRRQKRIAKAGLIAIEVLGAAMILLIFVWPHWHWVNRMGHYGLDATVLPIGTCLVMLGSVLRGTELGGAKGRVWARTLTAPVRWFGRHSYEVYMTHEFIVVWMTMLYLKVLRGPLVLWIFAMVALSAPLGWAVARWFSEPMNRRLRGAAPPVSQ